jgi:uncharacterized protein
LLNRAYEACGSGRTCSVSVFLLLASAIPVGVLIGAVGLGGVLLIPARAIAAGLLNHEAMATAISSFLFTGVLEVFLFPRSGRIDWGLTTPAYAGTAPLARRRLRTPRRQ